MRKCSGCQSDNDDDADFCVNCGTRNRAVTTNTPVSPPGSTQPAKFPPSKYYTASIVAGVLLVIGWAIVVLAPIVGIITAVAYEPDPFEENVAAFRILLLVGITLGGWLYAVFAMWMGYILRLLCDIEQHGLRQLR